MLLHCGIYILCNKKFHNILNDEANQFLRRFVTHAEAVFGMEFIVYNVHSLVHVASECQEHGPLDDCSAFPYESCLGRINHAVTSRVKPLAQIAKREVERRHRPKKALPQPNLFQMPLVNDPHEHVLGQQYKKIRIVESVGAFNRKDSCFVLHDDSVVIFKNIIDSENGPVIVCQKFFQTDNFYLYPTLSSLLGIWKVAQLLPRKMYFEPEDVKQKCYLMPLSEDSYVCVPLLHSV